MAGELILIVEDNEKNRKLVRDVLQFKGYQTVESETAEEGLRLAEACRDTYSITYALLGLGGTLVRRGHLWEAKGLLERGIDIICDKPLATNLEAMATYTALHGLSLRPAQAGRCWSR